MTTVSGGEARLFVSVTVSVKVSTVGVPGAMNVVTLSALLNPTLGPPICVQP